MTLYLIHHRTEAPAVNAMLAGVIAAAAQADFAVLDTGGGGLGAYEARQHVLDSGALAANGLFWYEWASGRPVPPALPPAVIARSGEGDVVVSVNPAISAESEMAGRLRDHATRASRDLCDVTVTDSPDGWHLSGALPPGCPDQWMRDRYGRPIHCPSQDDALGETPRLLLIGSETRLRDTYPAVIAALGDAADAVGCQPALAFWDPAQAAPTDLPDGIDSYDGIVLPGGADMDQVAGQIRCARHAIAADIPLLGLCLGMQTLTAAFAQICAGFNDANLEEADPDAETKVFRRMTPSEHPGAFRVGTVAMRPVSGTSLARILGDAPQVDIRANHRYVLDPVLVPSLERVGLEVCAWQGDPPLADAVNLPGHRFCIGLQGHPELQTRRDEAHPLFRAFVTAAAAAST